MEEELSSFIADGKIQVERIYIDNDIDKGSILERHELLERDLGVQETVGAVVGLETADIPSKKLLAESRLSKHVEKRRRFRGHLLAERFV